MLSPECGPGWAQLISDLTEDIKSRLKKGDCFKYEQVKEKYGKLRIYYYLTLRDGDDNRYDEIISLIGAAEEKSATICEKCGGKSKIKSRNKWLTTLCTKCYKRGLR